MRSAGAVDKRNDVVAAEAELRDMKIHNAIVAYALWRNAVRFLYKLRMNAACFFFVKRSGLLVFFFFCRSLHQRYKITFSVFFA